MKKILSIIVLLSLGALGYAAIEGIKQNIVYVKTVTHYVGSNINKYDLGDTEFFIEASAHSMFCMRKQK